MKGINICRRVEYRTRKYLANLEDIKMCDTDAIEDIIISEMVRDAIARRLMFVPLRCDKKKE